MKLWFLSLVILFGLITSKVWASSQTECILTDGIYSNSQANLGKFYFFSYADVFSINNAKSFILQIDGQELHFQRDSYKDRRQTQMSYIAKTSNGYRKIFITLDRAPKDILKTRSFIGNMVLSPEKKESGILMFDLIKESRAQTFNFSCRF